MFFDDYECNNALGSHKGLSKCGAVYLSVPCLPVEMRSKLENIFLFILFNSMNRQVFSNGCTFSKALDELRYLLSEGIEINHDQKTSRVYFSLELILGDNLGLHSLLGFNESFRSKYFCRFCLINKNDIIEIFNERNCTLRDNLLHGEHIKTINSSETGVKGPCIFTSIPGYNLFENMSMDVMHDYLEGVCQYDLGLILYHFIKIQKEFTLTQLNISIASFPFDKNEKNRPIEILEKHINNKRI